MNKNLYLISWIVLIISAVILMVGLIGCGKTYVCYECEESTTKAYYDLDAKVEKVLCEECARDYWMPLPYQNYRVK